MELTEYFLIGIISASVAFVTVIIKGWIDSKRLNIRSKEWFLDHLFKTKVKSILEINTKMTDCYRTLHYYGNFKPKDTTAYEKNVHAKIESFRNIVSEANIWLEEDTIKNLWDTVGAFMHMSELIYTKIPGTRSELGLPNESEIWGRLDSTYKTSKNILRKIIGTSALEKYAKEVLA
jgi:hypothetical protein